MTYIEQVREHSINESIEACERKFNEITETEISTEQMIDIGRITQIVGGFKTAYKNCPENLVSMKWLDHSKEAVNRITNELNAFKIDREQSHLNVNIFECIDILLENTVKFNCVRNRQSLRGVNEGFNQYIETMNKFNEKLGLKNQNFVLRLDKLNEQIDHSNEQLSSRIDHLTRMVDEEQGRIDLFTEEYQRQKDDNADQFSEQIRYFNEQFNVEQSKNKDQFLEIKTEYKKKQENLISEYEKRFKDYEEQVKNIVGIVNTNMFSHKYKQVADNAEKRSKKWHFLAVVLIAAVAMFAIYAFMCTTNDDTSWVKLVAKILATTTMATGAAYAARQASKQEKVERYARTVEMELVAIDPFINSLDDERKAQIKEELAFKIFGKEDVMELANNDDNDLDMISLKTVEPLLKLLKPYIK